MSDPPMYTMDQEVLVQALKPGDSKLEGVVVGITPLHSLLFPSKMFVYTVQITSDIYVACLDEHLEPVPLSATHDLPMLITHCVLHLLICTDVEDVSIVDIAKAVDFTPLSLKDTWLTMLKNSLDTPESKIEALRFARQEARAYYGHDSNNIRDVSPCADDIGSNDGDDDVVSSNQTC